MGWNLAAGSGLQRLSADGRWGHGTGEWALADGLW